jgi:hypothetical protein
MSKKTYIHLEDSEAAVLQVASRIYAAYRPHEPHRFNAPSHRVSN